VIAQRLKKICYAWEGWAVDAYLGIKTEDYRCGQPSLGRGIFSDSACYVSKPYLLLSAILSPVKIGPVDTFYDIGSGLGRVLFFVAWRQKPSACVGIELDNELYKASIENARRFAKRFPDRGAAQARYANGTVYFAFNPFGERTFSAVLERIEEDLARHPRPVTFIYFNAKYPEVFRRHGWELTRTTRVTGSPLQTMYFAKSGCPKPSPALKSSRPALRETSPQA